MANQLLLRRAGGATLTLLRLLRLRQRLTINLAVNVERQFVQHHQHRRHHVIRQLRGELRQQTGVEIGIGAQRIILHRAVTNQAMRGAHYFGDHHGGADFRQRHQRIFHFTEFDAETAHFNLVIGTANKRQLSILTPAHQVAAAVHHIAVAEGISDKASAGEIGTAQITARDAGSGDIQLASRTNRHLTQLVIQQIDFAVAHRTTNHRLR